MHVPFQVSAFIFSRGTPGMELLNHMVVLLLVFLETSILFSMVASPIDILPTVYKDFLFSASSPKIVISCLFDNSHSDRYEVTSHFDLHFSGDYQY